MYTNPDMNNYENSVFELTCREYLRQLNETGLEAPAAKMGAPLKNGSLEIPFFGHPYLVTTTDILAPDGAPEPQHAIKVVLCKYALMFPAETPAAADWVTYKDFKDAAPLVGVFNTNAQASIADKFENRVPELEAACRALGGFAPDLEVGAQVKYQFTVLPKLPIVLLFNDADEDLPSQATLLFERRAEKYLDMECLAIAGWLLADMLPKAIGECGCKHN